MAVTVNIIAGTFGRDLKTFQEETKTPICFNDFKDALSFADDFIKYTVPMKAKRSTYDLDTNQSVYYDTVLTYRLELVYGEDRAAELIETIKNDPKVNTGNE